MNARVATLLIAFLLMLGTPSAYAQAGHKFDGRALRLGRDSMRITMVRNDQRDSIGTLWNELSLDGATLKRVYRSENLLFGAHLDTLVSDWPALTARTQRTYSSIIRVSADYRNGGVSGWRWVSVNDTIVIRNLSKAPPYDAAMFDIMLRATDFAKDTTLSIQAFSAGQDTVLTLAAHFAGTERITVGEQSFETWKIEMDFAGMSSALWIEPQTRRLIRQIIRLREGIEMEMVLF